MTESFDLNNLVLLLVNFLATAYMTGLVWFVQIVHYPQFAELNRDTFAEFARRNADATGLVVAPAMIIEALTSVLLAFSFEKPTTSKILLCVNALLVLVIWLITIFCSIPDHRYFAQQGYSQSVLNHLLYFNWWRTILWSARSVILFFVLCTIER